MTARASRRMQFCAGPQTHTFYACADHAADLAGGAVSCFLVMTNEPVRRVDPAEEITCDLCREGGDV